MQETLVYRQKYREIPYNKQNSHILLKRVTVYNFDLMKRHNSSKFETGFNI